MPNQHTGGAISLEDLHELLWVYSTGGILRMRQSDIAADLLLSRQRITQLFQALEDDGRLTRNARTNSYTITDPMNPPPPGADNPSKTTTPRRTS